MSRRARSKGGCGCLPVLLGLILISVWVMRSETPRVEQEYFDPGPGGAWDGMTERSPRRPYPKGQPRGGEEYVIQDDGPPMDSQGTAFVIDRDGVWLTAEHVTRSCDRFGFRDGRGLEMVERVLESREADASLVRDGPATRDAFPVSLTAPRNGDRGYHMGFPSGRPTVVASRFIGTASARRGTGVREPIYAWAEQARYPEWNGELGGISGGPTFNANGAVIGINSAASLRRGRVLTTDPRAIGRLVEASGQVDERARPRPISDDSAARAFFQRALDTGLIVEVLCDVN